ncbi:MAG: VanW family protein, partial [Chloroflexota bacterium]|nr:VanW family protein [Chloroflexota bacterium]
ATVALAERPLPAAVPTDQAEAVAAQLDNLLAAPLRLTAGDESWPIAPDELAPLIRVDLAERDGRRALVPGLDDAGLRALVDRFAAEVDAPTADAWVEEFATHNKLHVASHGRTLRGDELAAALQEAVAVGRRDVPLPIDQGEAPAVTTEALLADLGVTEPIAEGDSDFAGSDAARDNNVRLAAERIDGTLVPPGGVFSYNAAVGTLFDSGFLFADANIEGLGSSAEGGGVCQVSTTVFRAALRAGLPIVEWWPHSFRSPFYEQGGWAAGFDASIVQVYGDDEAGTDFRFENPTDGWILIRSRIEGDALRVELRGTDPGYQVEFDEPIREWGEGAPGPEVEVDPALAPGAVVEDLPATDALTVTIVRRVLDAEGNEVSVDSFVSAYRPRGALRRVGPESAEGV